METSISVYLEYATAIAEGGNIEDGLAAYAEAMSLAEVIAAEPIPSGGSKSLHRVRAIIRAASAANAFAAIQECRVRAHYSQT